MHDSHSVHHLLKLCAQPGLAPPFAPLAVGTVPWQLWLKAPYLRPEFLCAQLLTMPVGIELDDARPQEGQTMADTPHLFPGDRLRCLGGHPRRRSEPGDRNGCERRCMPMTS